MKRLFALLPFLPLVFLITSCGNSGTQAGMSAADSASAAQAKKDSTLAAHKEIARASVENFNAAGLEKSFKDVAPDAVDYGNGEMKSVKGKDSVLAGLRVFMNAFPDFKTDIKYVLADGNMVAVFNESSGTFKNAMGSMKPTGKSFKMNDVDLFTFNDAGQMTEHRSVQSNISFLSQIGVKMK
ncbi:MAG: ester cyclase [Bacteroidota bacterium]|nr:ester cyclase [Bacteroidota bacterium]MDP4215109.1 ester cyclase [Bacteroidota bacterium]MDP4245148.1 ester cyclase [Bacteroidota bacterium]MDP4254436.1 ester cyclase [Bacteroidota bacterium]MDP4259451.1 ester cyclase [Bacteroidota bacterium]